jgi:hypothetical protein
MALILRTSKGSQLTTAEVDANFTHCAPSSGTTQQNLDLKANAADVATSLALKANASDVATSLALKADASDVTTALALKANAADVTASLDLKADKLLTINNQTGTSYTLVLADALKYIRMNNASASTLTVPPNASVAIPVGSTCHVRQVGAGQVTLVAGSGVTLNTPETLKLRATGAIVSLTKVATNEWDVYGDLEAA